MVSGSTYASSEKPVLPKGSYYSNATEKQAIKAYLDKLDHCTTIHSFCKPDKNYLQNDSLGMKRFYHKLTALRQGKLDRVNILQIGDSHLQSGFIPNEVRNGIQGYFGDAGRGLSFPYRTVGVGEAYDLTISTKGWKSGDSSSKYYTVKKGDTKTSIAHRFHRSIKSLSRLNPGLSSRKYLQPGEKLTVGISYRSLPAGFCGYSLKTFSNQNNMIIRSRQDLNSSKRFNKVTLLLDNTDSRMVINVSDLNGNLLTKMTIEPLPYEMNPVPITWSEPVSAAQLKISGYNGNLPRVVMYGLSLEMSQPGVLYHSIGINGAGFDRYNKNGRFMEQVKQLKPDLIIVSLGTNDAMGNFRSDICRKNINVFINSIRKALPNTDVLMTSPPDSYKAARRGKVENTSVPKVRDIVNEMAKQNGFAYWNLYEIMGGQGSMKKWVNSGLAQYDHKHFNAAGYREQGYLLRDSILQGYASYVERLD